MDISVGDVVVGAYSSPRGRRDSRASPPHRLHHRSRGGPSRRRGGAARLRPSLQPGVRDRDLADRPAAPPADRRLRPHAAPAPLAVPPGGRAGRGQDDHGRALHPRDARPPPAPPGLDRPAGRADRQLAAGTADPLRPRLPHRRRRGRPLRQSLHGHEQRPGHRQRRYPGERSPLRPAPGARRRALRPGDLRRGTQARGGPPARLHDPQDRPLPGRRGAGGHPGRRPPLVARLVLQPPPAADRHAAHGQGLPLLRPLAAAGARCPGDGGRLQRLPARRPTPPLHPPHQGGDGQLRRASGSTPTASQRHPELRPVAGRGQRADALRQDDRLHRDLLQPRPHPEPLGGAAGHVASSSAAWPVRPTPCCGRSSAAWRSSTG